MAMTFLPNKLVAKNGVPPVESCQEVCGSGLLAQIRKRSRTGFFSDGAKAYPKALAISGLRNAHSRVAVHSRQEFIRECVTPAGRSNLAGTMSIDSRWRALKQFVGAHVATKVDHQINPKLRVLCFSWLFCFNNQMCSSRFFNELGRLARGAKCPQVPRAALAH